MKFFVCLFTPKMIGQYFREHIIQPIIYLLFFVLLAFIPEYYRLNNRSDISYSNDIALYQSIRNEDSFNLKIENNLLSDTTTIYEFYGEQLGAVFNTSKVDSKYDLVLLFSSDYFNVISYGSTVATIKYSELEDSSIEFEKIKNHDFVETRKLNEYFNVAYDKYVDYSIVQTYAYSIADILMMFLLVVAFLVISSSFVNRVIPFKIKANISIYSSTWAFLLYFIGATVGVFELFYVGAILSFIFNTIAVKQIVKVEK